MLLLFSLIKYVPCQYMCLQHTWLVLSLPLPFPVCLCSFLKGCKSPIVRLPSQMQELTLVAFEIKHVTWFNNEYTTAFLCVFISVWAFASITVSYSLIKECPFCNHWNNLMIIIIMKWKNTKQLSLPICPGKKQKGDSFISEKVKNSWIEGKGDDFPCTPSITSTINFPSPLLHLVYFMSSKHFSALLQLTDFNLVPYMC